MSVVFAHSLCFLARLKNDSLNYLIDHILTLSVIGVDLFFVLSGFLIGGILIRTFLNTDFTVANVGQFWIRRWFRTLPNYWLLFTVDIVLYQVMKLNDFQPVHLLGYVFLQNLWYPNVLGFFPEGWSLAVEEWFYLTLPIAMYLAARIVKPVNKQKFLLRLFAQGIFRCSYLQGLLTLFILSTALTRMTASRKVVVFRPGFCDVRCIVCVPQLLQKRFSRTNKDATAYCVRDFSSGAGLLYPGLPIGLSSFAVPGPAVCQQRISVFGIATVSFPLPAFCK